MFKLFLNLLFLCALMSTASAQSLPDVRDAYGVAIADFDGDGLPDIYIVGFRTLNRMLINQGDGTFRDRSIASGTGGNLMPQGIRNLELGATAADYDNDGNLDFYLATGRPPYSILIPNRMFRNVNGQKFEDTTVDTGTGHLQKGHGVSFADGDSDGDLDLFVQTGGQTPADKSHNVFFENQSHGKHWLKLKLEGTKSNRSAIGAKVEASFRLPDGSIRKIYRVVSSGSSFGGNSLIVHLGLDLSMLVEELKIIWPSGIIESYSKIKADEFFHIKEGALRLNKVLMK